MLWLKALHIIFMVVWFSGLFYLPRLFVYHAMSLDQLSIARFKIMEKKLLHYITTPGALLTIVFGVWLIADHWQNYLMLGWVHAKLALVLGLVIYHVYCWHLTRVFQQDRNKHSHTFYRWFNEIPSVLLVGIVILAVVRPF